jgi:hypothetical protein
MSVFEAAARRTRDNAYAHALCCYKRAPHYRERETLAATKTIVSLSLCDVY